MTFIASMAIFVVDFGFPVISFLTKAFVTADCIVAIGVFITLVIKRVITVTRSTNSV